MKHKNTLCIPTVFFALGLSLTPLHAQQVFFPNGTYKEDVPTPEEALGFGIGDRPVRHHEAVHYLKTLADLSPRVRFFESGRTHENRLLCYVVISSEANMSGLESIRDNIAKLADPRKLKAPQALIESTPAVAWMMYSIHGDELSGVDAAVQLAYQLAAGTDATTMKILDALVVGIDPMENPDGRERYLAQMQQWRGEVPNPDVQAIQHTGVWPWGRGNHYLFDLNRDWFILAHPESRARVKAVTEWHPQVVVDAHEMGSLDTYLFNPPREPINPHIGKTVRKWWQLFSEDQAKAFDRYGWSYYTGEWYDDWYPGYGSSWPAYGGAISILYEQAQTDGSVVKKPDGTVSSFRNAVHHQFVSSVANLTTAADNRTALLNDFYTMRKQAASGRGAYYIVPAENKTRAHKLIERLRMQGIEVEVAQRNFTVKGVRSHLGATVASKTLPKGTFIIRLDQPLGVLVSAILDFDPRMLSKVLQKEREDLERGKGTHLYEVTSWSMLMAYDVEAYHATALPNVQTMRLEKPEAVQGKLKGAEDAVAYLCDATDDAAIAALLQMFQKGLKVRVAKKLFEIAGRAYARGTLLLRANENSDTLRAALAEISEAGPVDIYAIATLRSQKGPDLGGGEFQLLTEPRIAVLAGPNISTYSVGAIWYLLDHELKHRFSILNHDTFAQVDLRKYNVLVLPSAGGGLKTYHNIIGKDGIKKLKDWVNDGGTLIGISDGAAFLADSTSGISKVRLRRQALKDLQMFEDALRQENARHDKVDSVAVWEGMQKPEKKSEKEAQKQDVKVLTERDKRQRLYQPRGAILRVDLDDEHWLNFGLRQHVPAIVYSSYAFMSMKPVQTPGRFSNGGQLRLSGLLWPEARERWADTAYATREAHGKGQIILFAGEPNFRSYFYGTTRMLLNSMLLGPGMGTQQVVAW